VDNRSLRESKRGPKTETITFLVSTPERLGSEDEYTRQMDNINAAEAKGREQKI
jgi:hypothetical protein